MKVKFPSLSFVGLAKHLFRDCTRNIAMAGALPSSASVMAWSIRKEREGILPPMYFLGSGTVWSEGAELFRPSVKKRTPLKNSCFLRGKYTIKKCCGKPSATGEISVMGEDKKEKTLKYISISDNQFIAYPYDSKREPRKIH